MGVTTAATLWFVTVIGLCAGGGRIALAGGQYRARPERAAIARCARTPPAAHPSRVADG